MSVILCDKLTYLHKGFFSYEWRQSTFVLHSNGTLSKLKEGKVAEAIDLKNVVKMIKTKSAVDYVELNTRGGGVGTHSKLGCKKSSGSTKRELFNHLTFFSAAKNKSKFFNSIFEFHGKIENGKDAMLLFVPLKTASTRKEWIFLFMDPLKLDDWLRNINKWASIPRIEIDFVSLKDYRGYREDCTGEESYCVGASEINNSSSSLVSSTKTKSENQFLSNVAAAATGVK